MPWFEIVIEGVPVSAQSNDRAALARWRGQVQTTVLRQRLDTAMLYDEPLEVTVVYFYDGFDGGLDNDNMGKPILDALEGIVYVDDRQITDTVLRKRDATDPDLPTGQAPPVITEALQAYDSFVYVSVDPSPQAFLLI
jgi:Holliday junction resolvase RusA-like endonuclease